MSALQDVLMRLTSSRAKPALVPNTTAIYQRSGQDGSEYVQSLVPTKHVLADEGSYFVSTNPTPQTVLAYGSGGTQATFSDTVPFMQIINVGNQGDPTAPIVFFDYLKIIQIGGTAPAATTSIGFAIKLDNAFRTATSGTATTVIPVCANMNLAQVAPVGRIIYFTGAVPAIPAATPAARLVARGIIKGGPTLVLDEYNIASGIVGASGQQGYLTTVSTYTSRCPPFGVGPGQSASIYLWFLSGTTNPFSYEFELGHWER